MKTEEWQEIERLFHEARALPVEERAAFLHRASPADPELLTEIVKLLDSADTSEDFLSDLAGRSGVDAVLPRAESLAGRRVGPYRLITLIGRGGMGAVFRAVRADDQFEQDVAIKLLPAGLLSEESRRRFLNERQILARLEHPNIARLFDGGVLDDGTPYFVMELVDGRPIDAWCDEQRLDLRARIRLFNAVLDAVQYAHRNLVVHRDLKPDNVLVTPDGVVKLLDFGIARSLEGEAPESSTRRTVQTAPLTPAFASPEQFRGEMLTTSSDVYSLGVMLFVILTGTLPFRTEGRTAGEIERVHLHDPPPLPSRSALEDGVSAAADRSVARGVTAAELRRQLRGDLDTILLQALRKEPERRFPSVSELREDLRRHLDGEVISARRDNPAHVLTRLVNRHRGAVIAASAIVLLLAGLAVVSLRSAVQSRRQAEAIAVERDRARVQAETAQQVSRFLTDIFEVSDPDASRGAMVTARELLDRSAERIRNDLREEPLVRARLLTVIGSVYRRLGLLQEALPAAREAVALQSGAPGADALDLLESRHQLGLLLIDLGDYRAADSLLSGTLQEREVRLGRDHEDTAATLDALARTAQELGDFDLARRRYEEALTVRRGQLGEDDERTVATMNSLGVLLAQRDELDAAEPLLSAVLDAQTKRYGRLNTLTASSTIHLGNVALRRGHFDEAEPLVREALDIYVALHGESHPDVAAARNVLGNLLFRKGDYPGAEEQIRRALEIRRAVLGNDHPDVAKDLNDLGAMFRDREDYRSAEPLFRESLLRYRNLFGEDHAAVAILKANLASVLLRLQALDEAERLFRESIDGQSAAFGPDNVRVLNARLGLAMVHHERGLTDQAEPEYRELLKRLRTAQGEDHPGVALAEMSLGRLLVETGRAVDAEPLLRSAESTFRKTMGPDHLRTARSRICLAECLVLLSRFAEADTFLAAGGAVQNRHLPAGHAFVVAAHSVELSLRRNRPGKSPVGTTDPGEKP